MAKPRMGGLIACARCRNAHEEMEMLDRAFETIIARSPDALVPNRRALKTQMPGGDAINEQDRRQEHG